MMRLILPCAFQNCFWILKLLRIDYTGSNFWFQGTLAFWCHMSIILNDHRVHTHTESTFTQQVLRERPSTLCAKFLQGRIFLMMDALEFANAGYLSTLAQLLNTKKGADDLQILKAESNNQKSPP